MSRRRRFRIVPRQPSERRMTWPLDAGRDLRGCPARLRAGPTGRLTDTLLSTSEAIEMDARQKR